MACRDFAKAKRAAQDMNMDPSSYTVMHLDLASMDSVRQFADAFKASGRRCVLVLFDRRVCPPSSGSRNNKSPLKTAAVAVTISARVMGRPSLATLALLSLARS